MTWKENRCERKEWEKRKRGRNNKFQRDLGVSKQRKDQVNQGNSNINQQHVIQWTKKYSVGSNSWIKQRNKTL